jgi:hypothetical protein
VEVCQALLDDNVWRQQIATNAMTYFDRNFSPTKSCETHLAVRDYTNR